MVKIKKFEEKSKKKFQEIQKKLGKLIKNQKKNSKIFGQFRKFQKSEKKEKSVEIYGKIHENGRKKLKKTNFLQKLGKIKEKREISLRISEILMNKFKNVIFRWKWANWKQKKMEKSKKMTEF